MASGNGASALPAGIRILSRGGSALDAVEACAKIIEADTTDTSVGRGGKPNVLGEVELDASIVDGTSHRVGAVAALTGYLHPITVARAVMERTPHAFIVGDGAARFAREIGAETTQNLTPSTRKLWVERLRSVGETPASVRRRAKLLPVVRKTVREERGTVNFLALDGHGDLANPEERIGHARERRDDHHACPVPARHNRRHTADGVRIRNRCSSEFEHQHRRSPCLRLAP